MLCNIPATRVLTAQTIRFYRTINFYSSTRKCAILHAKKNPLVRILKPLKKYPLFIYNNNGTIKRFCGCLDLILDRNDIEMLL